MKRNVDLTQNRVFSNIVRTPIRITVNTPSEHTENFICGNASERKEAKFMATYESSCYCDRCGRRINVIPWRKEFGICAKCNEELEQQCAERYFWKYKKQDRTTNFVLIRMNASRGDRR